MILQQNFSVPANHPSLEGHFPGNPIVPGVVILDEIVSIACTMIDNVITWSGAPNVKFHSPLRPEEWVVLVLECPDSGEIFFRGQVNDRAIISGRLIYKPEQDIANST